MKSPGTTYLVILGGVVCWCAAILLAPLLLSVGGIWRVAGVVFYQFFHSLCHQLPERSFHILDAPLAVCIRCSAIYVGFLLGTLLYPPIRLSAVSIIGGRNVLIVSILPMLVDVILDAFGVHTSTDATRLITGALFGIVVPFSIIPAAQEAAQELLTASRFSTIPDFKKGSIHA